MKVFKGIFIFVLTGLIIFSLGGCSKGEELIKYYNSKRDAVIKEYVGTKVNIKNDPSSMLESYSYTADGANMYYITVENTDDEYFFDGVVHFKFDSQKISVIVHMLAPKCIQYFTVQLKEPPVNYTFKAAGSFYDWSDAAGTDIRFTENIIGNYVEQIVLDIDVYNDAIAQKLAKYFYSYDTLFNLDAPVAYYLVTADDYYAGYDYNYIMIVDTMHQIVTFKDIYNIIIKTVSF
jgi:hypothetical protein